jgi:hypothetical protein
VSRGGWPGCHGVRLAGGPDLGLGTCEGEPLLTATVREGPVPQPVGPPLRSLGAVDLHRVGPGEHVLATPGGCRVSVSVPGRRVTLASRVDSVASGGDPPASRVDPRAALVDPRAALVDPVASQIVASFCLPILLEGTPVLALHAAAAARAGRAVLVAGAGGSGKSSALIALAAAGWEVLSEDVCVLDLARGVPTAWPGPPWVRVRAGEAGPPGAEVVFSTGGKTGWDVYAWRARSAVPVGAAVVLEAPGGSAPSLHDLPRPAAIAALASNAVWLGEPAETARRLFGPVAAVASRVRVARLRLPVGGGWRGQLVGAVEDLLAAGV